MRSGACGSSSSVRRTSPGRRSSARRSTVGPAMVLLELGLFVIHRRGALAVVGLRRELRTGALERVHDLAQVVVQVLEDAVGVVLGSVPDRAILAARLGEHLLRLALGQLHDLLLGGLPGRLLAGLRDKALPLPLGFRPPLLAVLYQS